MPNKDRKGEPGPTISQVRDYILTMLDGLATLAEGAGDAITHDRLRDFTDGLLCAWTPKSEMPRKQAVSRARDRARSAPANNSQARVTGE